MCSGSLKQDKTGKCDYCPAKSNILWIYFKIGWYHRCPETLIYNIIFHPGGPKIALKWIMHVYTLSQENTHRRWITAPNHMKCIHSTLSCHELIEYAN